MAHMLPSRRGLLAGAAALAGTSGTASALGRHPDAELLTLCGEMRRIDAQDDALWAATDADMPGEHPAWEAHRTYVEASSPRWHDLCRQVCRTPAVTREGMAAKAQVLRGCFLLDANGEPDHGDPSDLLAWSLTNDLLAGRA